MPGERVQYPFLVLVVETRGGDDPHTMLILENCDGGIETDAIQTGFWFEFESIGEGVAKSEEGEGLTASLFATGYSLP